MANLTLPSNPVNGQKYEYNGRVFTYSSATNRWSISRLQLLGSLPEDVVFEAPSLGLSLSTVALDTVGANVYITYTVDQDVDASLSVSGIEDTTASLNKSNNTITVTTGSNAFTGGQITLTVTNGRTNVSANVDVSGDIPWIVDPSNITYDSISFSKSTSDMRDLAISPDGTKAILVDLEGAYRIRSYSLSVPNDISTMTEQSNKTPVGMNVSSIAVSPQGTNVIIGSYQNQRVYSASMSTAWDSSSLGSATANIYLGTFVQDVMATPDGTKVFVLTTNYRLKRYDLSTAWDMSSASFIGEYTFSSTWDTPFAGEFNSDGTYFYYYTINTDYIRRFSMTTPYDVQNMVNDNLISSSLVSQDGNAQGIEFSSNGKKFYLVGTVTDKIYQYSTGL